MARGLSRRALWMQKLADEVARGVVARINTGALAPGAALPDRAALAAEFVTSEGVIERALDDLRERGIVAEDGEAHYRVAADPPRGHGFELPSDFGAARADIVAILELRMGVEQVSAALAAERRSDAGLDRIRAAAAQHAEAGAHGEGVAQADFRFHRAIAEASGNPYILELLEYLGPLLIPRMRSAPSADPTARARSLDAARAEHDRIVAAIAARDGDGARVAMREHLARIVSSIQAAH